MRAGSGSNMERKETARLGQGRPYLERKPAVEPTRERPSVWFTRGVIEGFLTRTDCVRNDGATLRGLKVAQDFLNTARHRARQCLRPTRTRATFADSGWVRRVERSRSFAALGMTLCFWSGLGAEFGRCDFVNLGAAGGAEGGGFEVDPFYGVGGGHHALVVIAMSEGKGVAKFVDSFFEQAGVEEGGIGREAVKFLAEAVGGQQGAGSLELSFAENEGEDRDVEIDGGDAEEARRWPAFRGCACARGFRWNDIADG